MSGAETRLSVEIQAQGNRHMSRKKRTRLKLGPRHGSKRAVSTKPLPWNGDHGPGTSAALAGTEMVPLEGPNRMAQRRRVCVIDTLTSLTMRQHQAAHALRNAYGRVDSLSSGSPLKERVQSSPKPDATIAAQVDAQSQLARCTKAIPAADRRIVDHVCWHNLPITQLGRMGYVRPLARFANVMDRIADKLGY